jgi:3-oxoacyl-[acyl-carrier protein] reductase
MRLENKVAIITGAGSGIGRETALLFAKEGAKVVAVDINEERGKQIIKEIENAGGEAIFFKMDVSNWEHPKEVCNFVKNKYGKIDVLINCAGIIRDALVTKMTEDQWNSVIDVNLKGPFNCIRAVVDTMMEHGTGVIINVSSIIGLYGNIGQANYAAAKAGLIGITKALAKELGKKGIRVNAVAPGFIETPMTAQVPEKILQFMKEKTPIGRLGKPGDVAYALLYLASDEANFVNGAVLSVDGGLLI